MRTVKKLLLSTCLVTSIVAFSQETEEFKPSGKVSGQVFTDYSSKFDEDKVNEIGINVERAYLGYNYNVTKEFSTEIKLDVAGNDDVANKRVMFLKTAFGKYALSESSTIEFGLMGTKQMTYQEKAWGYRYLYKTFQDLHKYGNTADLGISLSHKASDKVSLDLSIYNGEGFKYQQKDKDFVYAMGLTLEPSDMVLFRLYGDYSSVKNTPSTVSSLLSLKPSDVFSFGLEYNFKYNAKAVEEQYLYGVSVYTNYVADEKTSVFLRYDKLWSNTLSGQAEAWNYNKDGNAIVTGVQYMPNKNLKLALTYNTWLFDNSANLSNSVMGVFVEFKF